MTKVNVDPGVCGLKTTVYIESEDMQNAVVKAETECPHIRKLIDSLDILDSFNEIFLKYGESEVFKAANLHCQHATCPVPTAILKGIEVECGLALPKAATIEIIKE